MGKCFHCISPILSIHDYSHSVVPGTNFRSEVNPKVKDKGRSILKHHCNLCPACCAPNTPITHLSVSHRNKKHQCSQNAKSLHCLENGFIFEPQCQDTVHILETYKYSVSEEQNLFGNYQVHADMLLLNQLHTYSQTCGPWTVVLYSSPTTPMLGKGGLIWCYMGGIFQLKM